MKPSFVPSGSPLYFVNRMSVRFSFQGPRQWLPTSWYRLRWGRESYSRLTYRQPFLLPVGAFFRSTLHRVGGGSKRLADRAVEPTRLRAWPVSRLRDKRQRHLRSEPPRTLGGQILLRRAHSVKPASENFSPNSTALGRCESSWGFQALLHKWRFGGEVADSRRVLPTWRRFHSGESQALHRLSPVWKVLTLGPEGPVVVRLFRRGAAENSQMGPSVKSKNAQHVRFSANCMNSIVIFPCKTHAISHAAPVRRWRRSRATFVRSPKYIAISVT